MGISITALANALKVDQTITQDDEQLVDKIWKANPMYCTRNEVYQEIITRRIIDKISKLVDKLEQL